MNKNMSKKQLQEKLDEREKQLLELASMFQVYIDKADRFLEAIIPFIEALERAKKEKDHESI